MQVPVEDIEVGQYISYEWVMYRGKGEWTPVRTGYREVISKHLGFQDTIQIVFRDTSGVDFAPGTVVELKTDWPKEPVVEDNDGTENE